MSAEDENESRGNIVTSRNLGFAVATLLILALPVSLFFLAPHLPIVFLDLITIANIVASLLLSLAIVYIYVSLHDVQETQTDILDNQESLMRLQNLPQVTITSWDVEDNTLEFTLANLGDGVATNISADIRVLPQTVDYSEGFDSYPKPLYQANEDTRKSFLFGKETANFVGPAIATTVVDNVQDWDFTRVINHLHNKDEERIEFVVKLRYEDLFGEKTWISVTSRVTDIHVAMTFEEAVTNSDATNTAVRHIPRDTELERFDAIDQRGIFFDPRKES
jgi:hypothetical protein